jgi:hypothetical protein
VNRVTTELAAFFETLDRWDSEDVDLLMSRFNAMRRRRPSSIGRLAPFGVVRGLGALGVWGCGGQAARPSALFT